MEPTAAMAHTRLPDSSIPETWEAAVTDANARKTQKERQRGEGTRRWKEREGEGRREGKTGASPRFLVCDRRLSLLEQRLPAQPSSACPPLKPPPTRPVSHSHTWQGETRTHTHTHERSLASLRQKKQKRKNKSGAGEDGGGR